MHPALLIIWIEFGLCAAVIGVAGVRLSLLLTQQGSMPQLGHISLASLLILAIYPVGTRALPYRATPNAVVHYLHGR